MSERYDDVRLWRYPGGEHLAVWDLELSEYMVLHDDGIVTRRRGDRQDVMMSAPMSGIVRAMLKKGGES